MIVRRALAHQNLLIVAVVVLKHLVEIKEKSDLKGSTLQRPYLRGTTAEADYCAFTRFVKESEAYLEDSCFKKK
jgi:hypothetical protein